MKKLLIGLIALGSISAFATTKCDVSLTIGGDLPSTSQAAALLSAEEVLVAKGFSIAKQDSDPQYALIIDTMYFDRVKFATLELQDNVTGFSFTKDVIKDPIGPFGINIKHTWSSAVKAVVSKLPRCK